MKKEYVKPQNRVVVLKGNLLGGDETISGGGHSGGFDAKQFDIENSDGDSDHDVWED
jgi:hypothetical protein